MRCGQIALPTSPPWVLCMCICAYTIFEIILPSPFYINMTSVTFLQVNKILLQQVLMATQHSIMQTYHLRFHPLLDVSDDSLFFFTLVNNTALNTFM